MELLEEFLGSEFVGAALYAAFFSFLFMLIAVKGAIWLLMAKWFAKAHDGEPPEDWPARSLVINFVTFLLATGIIFIRYPFEWLASICCGALGAAFSIAGYEPLKNLLGAVGFDLDKLNAFHYYVG
jgi:hypothetical protein